MGVYITLVIAGIDIAGLEVATGRRTLLKSKVGTVFPARIINLLSKKM